MKCNTTAGTLKTILTTGPGVIYQESVSFLKKQTIT